MAFAAGGDYLVYCAEDNAVVWDRSKQEQGFILRGHSNTVARVVPSPAERIVATLSHDHTVKLWNLDNGQPIHTLTGHRDRPFSAGFTPDGKSLATASREGEVFVWDVATGQLLLELEDFEGSLTAVYFSDAENLVAIGHGSKSKNSDCLQIGVWRGERQMMIQVIVKLNL